MLPLQTYHTFYPGSPSLRAGPSTKMLFHFTFREKYSSSFATHSMTPFLTTVPQVSLCRQRSESCLRSQKLCDLGKLLF